MRRKRAFDAGVAPNHVRIAQIPICERFRHDPPASLTAWHSRNWPCSENGPPHGPTSAAQHAVMARPMPKVCAITVAVVAALRYWFLVSGKFMQFDILLRTSSLPYYTTRLVRRHTSGSWLAHIMETRPIAPRCLGCLALEGRLFLDKAKRNRTNSVLDQRFQFWTEHLNTRSQDWTLDFKDQRKTDGCCPRLETSVLFPDIHCGLQASTLDWRFRF